jgi:HEAT repeat protein
MNKRAIIFALIGGMMGLVALGIFLDPTRTALGYLRGEKFYQGRPTGYWRKALLSEDSTALASADAVPVLIESLTDRNQQVRGRAAAALGEIGPSAKEAVPALLALLKDTKGNLDSQTMEYLRKVEEMKQKHPGLAVEVEFDTPETATRYAAAEAVKRIDPDAAKQAGIP